jgi:hypothetical protein
MHVWSRQVLLPSCLTFRYRFGDKAPCAFGFPDIERDADGCTCQRTRFTLLPVSSSCQSGAGANKPEVTKVSRAPTHKVESVPRVFPPVVLVVRYSLIHLT